MPENYDGTQRHLVAVTRVFWRNSGLLLVPEDRQRNQRDGDDPQNDVFAAVFFFFFCHKKSVQHTPNSGSSVQQISSVTNGEPQTAHGFAAAAARLYSVNFTISRIWMSCVPKCSVSSTFA